MFTSVQVCERAGVSYRQLDYWARTGLLEPSIRHGSLGHGLGRLYSADDLRCATVLAALAPTGSRGSGAFLALRRVVADALRSHPSARFVVVLDGITVEVHDTVEDAVAATHRAKAATIIWPDRILAERDDERLAS